MCVCMCACEKDGEEGGGKTGRRNVCRGASAREKDEGKVTGKEDKCVWWRGGCNKDEGGDKGGGGHKMLANDVRWRRGR